MDRVPHRHSHATVTAYSARRVREGDDSARRSSTRVLKTQRDRTRSAQSDSSRSANDCESGLEKTVRVII